jgi:hypothetical protein
MRPGTPAQMNATPNRGRGGGHHRGPDHDRLAARDGCPGAAAEGDANSCQVGGLFVPKPSSRVSTLGDLASSRGPRVRQRPLVYVGV